MKILIVQLGRIGDTILTTPLFKVIKENIPNVELHVLSGRNNYHVLVGHPSIDKVFIYGKKIFSSLKMFTDLRKIKYDFWIDIKDHYSNESMLFSKIGRAKIKIGFNRPGKKIFDINPHEEYQNINEHYVEICLRNVKYLDINMDTRKIRPSLFTKSESEKNLISFLNEQNIEDYYCINISATAPSRMLQMEKWDLLLEEVKKDGKNCVLVAAPKDNELVERICNKHAHVVYYQTKSIVDVFSVVKKCEAVLTVDTSVVHIASSFNKPQLCFYTYLPHKMAEFAPLSDVFKVVMGPNIEDSVTDIKVEDVLKNYNEIKIAINE